MPSPSVGLLSSFMLSLPLASWVLAKVQQDDATGMLVTTFWSTQPWFPQLLELLIDHPRLLQPKKDLLQLNRRLDMVHPLHSKLAFLVTIISGQPSKVQAYNPHLYCLERGNQTAIQQHTASMGRVLLCTGNPSCYSSYKCG